MSGKIAAVTGGSNGLGFGIARRLAAAGAEVTLPVRDQGKGEAAITRSRDVVPGGAVSTRILDLSSLESVRQLSLDLMTEDWPINVLINNAGVMNPPSRQVTQEGFELQYGTNHLSHFALVGQIMPLLRAGSARITTQTSISASYNAISWDDLQREKAGALIRPTASPRLPIFSSFSNSIGELRRVNGVSPATLHTPVSPSPTSSPNAGI